MLLVVDRTDMVLLCCWDLVPLPLLRVPARPGGGREGTQRKQQIRQYRNLRLARRDYTVSL